MADSIVIGVHISGGVLRRAELLRRGGQIEVARLETVSFPAEPGGASRSADRSADGASLNGSRRVTAMPAMDVMSRCWPLPAVGDHKLRQMVAHRLEADLPVPMDQIIWGYRRAIRAGADGGNCTVLAQAARSERISQYMASLSTAGIGIDLLTTEAEGLAGLYRHGLQSTGSGVEALLLAGAEEWLLCVFAGGLAHAVRRIRVDPERPEVACRECRQLLGAQVSSGAVERVRYCAAVSGPEVCGLLAEFCGIPVEPAELGDHLVLPGGERLPEAQLVEFGPAIGLGLAWLSEDRDCLIRLAGREKADAAEPLRRLEGILARPWTWAAVAAVLLILAATIHVGSLRSGTRRMREAIAHGSVDSAALNELTPKLRAVQRLERFRIDVEGICADICTAIKDPIMITSLQLSRERRLTIKGNSKDPKAVFTFADDLRKSSRFRNVNLERTSPAQGGDFLITVEPTGFERFSSPALRGAR